MKVTHSYQVKFDLPSRLFLLKKLAYNVWFSWKPEVVNLFQRIDPDLWESVYHNPVLFLGRISKERLTQLEKNESFCYEVEKITKEFDRYLTEAKSYDFGLEGPLDFTIAYFSAEYGLTECIPNYSGGLGVLSGDHIKSASDLNLPMVGIGLLYHGGYFRQYLNNEGWQLEFYPDNDFYNIPIKKEIDASGNPVQFDLDIKNRTVRVQIWRIQAGRIPLFMLDTNLPVNHEEDRKITYQLYGGDREMRLRQEIVLGIGGMKALKTLGIEPAVHHMNEGHSAFAALEKIRQLIDEKGVSFDAALEAVTASNVFTTHTPVPAGNDRFEPELMRSYFKDYAQSLGLTFKQFLAFGREDTEDNKEPFCMTVLALKTSIFANGVSELHSKVSRAMWKRMWSRLPVSDIPIEPITNGIHTPSWISNEMASLFTRYLGPRWVEDPDNEKVWEKIDQIPDTELWRTHEIRRERLVTFARKRLREQLKRRGASSTDLSLANEVLNPEALTIGFARRFATYKRGNLVFLDPSRLGSIINSIERPVQLIFAGKAHPQDIQGKELIKSIIQITKHASFRHRIVFIEDYDINVARYMMQGVDVWLNTPRRPLEACGTSGMKAAANGVLNMSILDGWWMEAYARDNGWAIGSDEEFDDSSYQDEIEARAIYDLLEKEIIPLFYIRGQDGLPKEWIARMKNSMRSLCPVYNTHRMVQDYLKKFYCPAARFTVLLQNNALEGSKKLAQWKSEIESRWSGVQINDVRILSHREFSVGMELPVEVELELNGLSPDVLQVELYYGQLNSNGDLESRTTNPMEYFGSEGQGKHQWKGKISCGNAGEFGYAVRIQPRHPDLNYLVHMKLVTWG